MKNQKELDITLGLVEGTETRRGCFGRPSPGCDMSLIENKKNINAECCACLKLWYEDRLTKLHEIIKEL